MNDAGLERALRRLSNSATSSSPEGAHADEPLLALMRHGDHGDDIADAIAHVAGCADCRARLALGDAAGREVVVVAIEAPRMSHPFIAKAAEATSARLVERGEGRWTAVVDADRADKLKGELVAPNGTETSVVSRLAMTPVRVPREEVRQGRKTMSSVLEMPEDNGTDAAEVQAWAQIHRAPRRKVDGAGLSSGWTLFATAAVLGAIAIAYLLAIR